MIPPNAAAVWLSGWRDLMDVATDRADVDDLNDLMQRRQREEVARTVAAMWRVPVDVLADVPEADWPLAALRHRRHVTAGAIALERRFVRRADSADLDRRLAASGITAARP